MLSMMVPAALALAAATPAAASAVSDPDPPIRLWMNNDREYREGDQVRVQVETRDDGYLVVFNYDGNNHLRILFPVDPGEDNFVHGGHRYEIRGRGNRESFVIDGSGDGLVYAAISADPFRFDEYRSGNNWDLSRVSIGQDSKDPEADINQLLQQVSSDRGFDYDVMTYRVYGYRTYVPVAGGFYPRPYWDDYYACNPWWSRWGCGYPGLFAGLSYDPFGYYPYGYYGGYGYGYGYGYPWGWGIGTGGYVRGHYPVAVGRPRGYTIAERGVGSYNLGGGFNRGRVASVHGRGALTGGTVGYHAPGFENRARSSWGVTGGSAAVPRSNNSYPSSRARRVDPVSAGHVVPSGSGGARRAPEARRGGGDGGSRNGGSYQPRSSGGGRSEPSHQSRGGGGGGGGGRPRGGRPR